MPQGNIIATIKEILNRMKNETEKALRARLISLVFLHFSIIILLIISSFNVQGLLRIVLIILVVLFTVIFLAYAYIHGKNL